MQDFYAKVFNAEFKKYINLLKISFEKIFPAI